MTDESTSFLVRDVPPDDMRRFRAATARVKISLQAAIRQHIHAVAEDERLRERAEMMERARRRRSDRPSIPVDVLRAGLDADRADWNGTTPE